MKKRGQLTAIDILPDGRILDGWTRWLAAQQAGITELRVIVHDLDETAAKIFILEANIHFRHHYDKLTVARIYHELKILMQGESGKGPDGGGEVRDRLAKRFKISGRTLDRLEKMLDTPEELQQAYRDGEVTDGLMVEAAKLSPKLKKEIAAAIKQGVRPDWAVERRLPPKKPRPKADPKPLTEKPKVTDEDPVDGAGHGDETPGEPVVAPQTLPAAALPAEDVAVVEHGEQTEGTGANMTGEIVEPSTVASNAAATPAAAGEQANIASETVKVAEPTVAEDLQEDVQEDIQDDDPVDIYGRMLEELPDVLDLLVEKIDTIAGEAMAPEAAVVALQRIAENVQKLIEVEEAMVEVMAGTPA